MITPKPQAPSRLVAALSAFKASPLAPEIIRSKGAIRSQPSSSAPAPMSYHPGTIDITHERRYVQGLGHVRADVVPRRSRRAVVEAKFGNLETKNEVVHASAITTIGGFVYDRDYANEVDSDVLAGTIRSGMVPAARLPTITTVHPATSVMPMSGVVDIWEAQEAVVGMVHSASCQIA